MSNHYAYDVEIKETSSETRRITGVDNDGAAIKQAKAGKGQSLGSRKEKIVTATRVDLSGD